MPRTPTQPIRQCRITTIIMTAIAMFIPCLTPITIIIVITIVAIIIATGIVTTAITQAVDHIARMAITCPVTIPDKCGVMVNGFRVIIDRNRCISDSLGETA